MISLARDYEHLIAHIEITHYIIDNTRIGRNKKESNQHDVTQTTSADTNNLNRSNCFLWWNDHHRDITRWPRQGLPHSIPSQSIKSKPAKNPLVRRIVEVGLNPPGQRQTAAGHRVLLVFFEGSFTVARERVDKKYTYYNTITEELPEVYTESDVDKKKNQPSDCPKSSVHSTSY